MVLFRCVCVYWGGGAQTSPESNTVGSQANIVGPMSTIISVSG